MKETVFENERSTKAPNFTNLKRKDQRKFPIFLIIKNKLELKIFRLMKLLKPGSNITAI